MLTEDWMMRQVDALARSIAYLVFQKESTRSEERRVGKECRL